MEYLSVNNTQDRTRYFVRPKKVNSPQLRLVTFPYAGASAVVYHQWASCLPPDIELITIQYPGRAGLINRKPCTSIGELAVESYETLLTLADKPFYFFGHSMGGAVAFETARMLCRSGQQGPKALILSACNPPQSTKSFNNRIHTLPDDLFLEAIQRYGGMPDEILKSPAMMSYLMPLLRADMKALDTWTCEPAEPLNIPMLVLGGDNDESVDLSRLPRWRDFTCSIFKFQIMPGDHFYIQDQLSMVVNTILGVIDGMSPVVNETTC